jgi:DivIVA domain-containing protein
LIVYVVLLLLAVALVLAVLAVAAGRGDAMAAAPADRRPPALPSGRPLVPGDLDHLRLPVTVRGYRMDEVDAVLDRVSTELAERDALIARLMARLAARRPVDPTPPADRSAPPVEGS